MRSITCTECGASFEAAGSRDKTCSPDCAKLRAKRNRPARTPGRRDESGRWIVRCKECGDEYPAVAGRRTCSIECETKRKRRRWRAYWHSLDAAGKKTYATKATERRSKNPEHYRELERRAGAKKRGPVPLATCRVCGRKFQGKRKDSRFCRAECRAAVVPLPGAERRLTDGTCKICHHKFMGRRNQMYCGLQCSREALARRQRKARRETAIADDIALAGLAIALERSSGKYLLTCQECGTAFRSDSPARQTCSTKCSNAKWARRRRDSRVPAKLPCIPCEVCRGEFTPDRRNAKTCSEWCRAQSKRQAMNARSKTPEMRERLKQLLRIRKKTVAHCIVCGRDMLELSDLRSNRYTCSPECRREAYRRKIRRSYARRAGIATDKRPGDNTDRGAQGAVDITPGADG